VRQDLLEILERQAQAELRVERVEREGSEQQDPVAQVVRLDLQVLPEEPGELEGQEVQVRVDLLEQPDQVEQQVALGELVELVHLVQVELQDHQEQQEGQEGLVKQDLQERLDHRVILGQVDLPEQVLLVLRVPLVLQVRQDHQELNMNGKELGLLQLNMLLMIVLKMTGLVMFVYQLILQEILMMNPELVQLGKLIGIY